MNGNNAGKIIIGTDIDESGYEKKIEKINHDLKNKDVDINIKVKEIQNTKNKIESLNHELEKTEKEMDEIAKDTERFHELKFKIEGDENLTQGEYNEYLVLNMAKIDEQEQELLLKMEKIKNKRDDENATLEKQERQLENLNFQYNELVSKQEQLVKNHKQIMVDNVTNNVKEIGKGINNIVKKVAKWGLAIFGISTAFSAIRTAMSTLQNYDEQLATDIKYMQFAIATALEPVVRTIVDLMWKLLQYVNAISEAWFNYPLFANATAKAFKNANKNAKQLNKTIAKFDEMQTLTKEKDNIGTPTNDLSTSLNKDEYPQWLKDVIANKDFFLNIGKVLAGAFAVSKVTGWIRNLAPLFGAKGLGGISTLIGEIALIAGAIVITGYVASEFKKDLDDTKEQIRTIRQNGAKGYKEWVKGEKDLAKLIDTTNVNRSAGYDLLDKSKGVFWDITGLSKENLDTAEQVVFNTQEAIDKTIDLYTTTKLEHDERKKVVDNIVDQINYNDKVIKRLEEEGRDTSEIKKLNEKNIDHLKTIKKWLEDNEENTAEWKDEYQQVSDTLDYIQQMKIEDKSAIINVDVNTDDAKKSSESFLSWLGKEIGKLLSPVSENDSDTTKVAKATTKAVTSTVTKGIKNALGNILPFTKTFSALDTLKNIKLFDKGGLINLPGKGVPLTTNAIGGERGVEGILPLTDEEQMTYLGNAIGKYVNINLTNITQLDGRTIARKVDKINQENNFILNR